MSQLGYIAIEGPIGVGKTTLAHKLAENLEGRLLLESPEENPFLGPFYDDPGANALSAQLFFLLQRARQIDELRQQDLFAGRAIADFMFDKDPLFAGLTLSGPELALYRDIYHRLAWQAPVPDRVIYLHAPPDVLARRVQRRGRPQEGALETDYLCRVADRYAEFFRTYRDAPLITVETSRLNLVGKSDDYRKLLAALSEPDPLIHL